MTENIVYSVEDQIKNIETQKKYVALAWDFLNQMDFKGHLAQQLTETQLFLKGFHDALATQLKVLQDGVETIKVKPEAVIVPEVIKSA